MIGGGAAAAAGGAAAYAAAQLSGPGGGVVDGRSRARAIATQSNPPAAADVVIIGGGIIGSAAAFLLAQRGVSVTLLEKGAIGGEASGRAQGQVSSAGLDPIKLPLVNRSKQLWEQLNATAKTETGYRTNGLVSGIRDAAGEAFWGEWLNHAGSLASQARLVSGAEADRLLPSAAPWRGAFVDPAAGGVEPTLAAPALAEAARRLGAHIVAPCAARGFETSGGRISHVVTEKGAVRTQAVILAGGAWSTLFAANAGIRLPSLNVFSTVLRAVGGPGGLPGNFDVPGAGGRLQLDGSITLGATKGRIAITPEVLAQLWDFRDIVLSPPWDVQPHLGRYFFQRLGEGGRWKLDAVSPMERQRILQPSLNADVRRHIVDRIRAELPGFAQLKVIEAWAGAINATPDNMPVIGPVESAPGLFLATGFSYGMTMGPAAAEAVTDLVLNRTPAVDLRPYRHSRYTDGTKLVFTH